MPTKIEWVRGSDGVQGETWNPVLGCSKKSPGCKGCYAIRVVHRLAGNPNPTVRKANAGLTVVQGGKINWTGIVRLIPSRLTIPVKKKAPTTYFVNSLSDLFHHSLPDEDVVEVFRAIHKARHHQFQILTKTSDRMAEIMPRILATFGPMPHALLGVSVENQEWADARRDHLRSVAALGYRTFVSYEPALGPVDWTGWEFIAWLISGGESGPRKEARPTHPDWHRAACAWCIANGIPYFFKQWGCWWPMSTTTGIQELPFGEYVIKDGQPMFGFIFKGKKAAGALLDGREWKQMPEVRDAIL